MKPQGGGRMSSLLRWGEFTSNLNFGIIFLSA